MDKHKLFSTFIKEPLFHFLLIGFGLFFLFEQVNKEEETSKKQEIIIKKSLLTQLSMDFIDENGREAKETEIQTLLEQAIREEVLYHEALAMGLDKDDKVIRHRLAEKIKYLFEDISIMDEPSDSILKSYAKDKPKKFDTSADYADIKDALKQAWIQKEQDKENEAFYQSLKNRYELVVDNEIKKVLDKSTIKQ